MTEHKRFRRFLWYFFKTLSVLFFPVKLEGKLPEGAYLLALNHQSFLDAIAVFLVMPENVRFMAKKQLFGHKFVSLVITTAGAFPVDRENTDMDALRTSLTALKDGSPLVIFPEGHRYKDGQVHELKEGASFIALRAQVPVQTGRIFSRYLPFCPVRIKLGELIPAARLTSSKDMKELTERIKAGIEAVS